MDRAISLINEMPSTKEQVSDFVAKLKSEILFSDPLHFAIQMRAIEDVIKKLRADKDVRDHIISEIEKYGKETTVNGNVISVIEAGVKYDYQDDEKLQKLLDKEILLKLKIKARQAELKSGVGELPAIKSSTTTFKIILK